MQKYEAYSVSKNKRIKTEINFMFFYLNTKL